MVQTVTNAISILNFISDQPRSLGEIAEHLDVHKSTALRMLQTLEEGRFVRRPSERTFGIGFGLVAIGQKALEQIEVRSVAHPLLQRLRDRCGHTIHLAQLVDTSIIYVDKVDGQGPAAFGSRIGSSVLLHTAAVAKIILAYQSNQDAARLIGNATFEQFTPTTLATPAALKAQLDVARKRGWAEDQGEHEDYLNCVGLPVRDATGAVNYGMSITAFKSLTNLETLREQIPIFRETADELSRALGWSGQK
jgi:DNA-binding IclR family transcriptional regulator